MARVWFRTDRRAHNHMRERLDRSQAVPLEPSVGLKAYMGAATGTGLKRGDEDAPSPICPFELAPQQ